MSERVTKALITDVTKRHIEKPATGFDDEVLVEYSRHDRMPNADHFSAMLGHIGLRVGETFAQP